MKVQCCQSQNGNNKQCLTYLETETNKKLKKKFKIRDGLMPYRSYLRKINEHIFSQDKVYNEIIEVLGQEDRFVEMNDVSKMSFLEQCIKETMRMFLISPCMFRKAEDDLKLSTIPQKFNNFGTYKKSCDELFLLSNNETY